MFSRATANFVQQVDPDGSLIHVRRINDSRKLHPGAVVVKRKPIWFWRTPKYYPTDFCLRDLLLGSVELSLETSGGDFVTYSGTFGDDCSGKLETEAMKTTITLEGHGAFKLQSKFGPLWKDELLMKKMIEDPKERLVNMNHQLVKQLEKKNVVLAVVKEAIRTTDVCSVMQKKTNQWSLRSMLCLIPILGSRGKVCVTETSSLEQESDISLEIPARTVIAYSVLELEIKNDGHYEICLHRGKNGGFEADMLEHDFSQESLCEVDGGFAGDASLNGSLEMKLSVLAQLPQSIRQALFQDLCQTMRESDVLSCLQSMLEGIFLGEKHDVQQEALHDSQRQLISGILALVGEGDESGSSGSDPAALLLAVLLMVSAIEELTNETRSLLSESQPEFIEACNEMVCVLKETETPVSFSSLPWLLQESQAFQRAERLFHSTNLPLRRDGDSVWMDEASKHRVQMLVLCLTLHALSSLCRK